MGVATLITSMSLESENRLATPLKVPPPTRTFTINPLNYQAPSAGKQCPGQRREVAETPGLTWAVGDGTQVRLSTALSAVAPSATAALIGFVCPQQHRLRRAEVARVGFLVPPHHYCGQDVIAISTRLGCGVSAGRARGFGAAS